MSGPGNDGGGGGISARGFQFMEVMAQRGQCLRRTIFIIYISEEKAPLCTGPHGKLEVSVKGKA